MATERGGSSGARRRGRGRLVWWTGVLLVGGCVGSPDVRLPNDHPANPRAAAGALTASLALASYRSAADFAGRQPAPEGAGEAGALVAGGATAAGAGAGAGHGAPHGQGQVAQAAGPKPSGVGIINAVQPDRRSVNISHEPIPSVGFPAMTMDLPVTSSVDLQAVRPGSRVTFTLTRGPDGLFMIDSITVSSETSPPGRGAPAGGEMPGHGSMPGTGHGGMPMPGGQPPAKRGTP